MKYLDYVNIKMGTRSTGSRSHGNTNPLVARPFGMNHFLVQTREERNWFYYPDDVRTTGIRLTHIPSPWIGDYARLVMMPTTGNSFGAAIDRRRESSFDNKRSVMTPAEIDLTLIRYGVRVQFSPTVRGGAMRFTWDKNVGRFMDNADVRRFVLEYKGTEFGEAPYHFTQIDYEKGIIRGYTNQNRGFRFDEAADNFKMFFVLEFDTALSEEGAVLGDGVLNIPFSGSPNVVELRFATSFISMEQAEYNLATEAADRTLEEIREECESEWEERLSRIAVEAEERLKRTFYSCLYRCFLFPRIFHESTSDGKRMHYSPCDGQIHEGPLYVDNGFWDTYKTVYPLYSLIASDLYRDTCEGFVNFYREGGWLPRWTAPCAVNCMPGTAIDAVFGDAAVKGVVTDKELLSGMLESLLQHSDNVSTRPAYGRDGLEAFKTLGYVSDEYRESVNKTLDYAYGDFCISRVSDALGETEISKRLLESAQKYRNLFDPETGFMRARNRAGERRADFSEFDWGGDYTEGGPWQNSFAVYHDFYGYAQLLGGREEFLSFIQRLFDTPPYFKEKGYNCEIHEMTEMVLENGFGQCALSNQPSFHVPYLFSCMGDRDSTAYWVKRCVNELFDADSAGFPGDEDNGSMAAWFVFSALGFYPVCPGVPEYVLAVPSVERAEIRLDNGRNFTVSAYDNTAGFRYASKITLNGENVDKVYLTHGEIKGGGVLKFDMDDAPSWQEYTDDQLPYSQSK